VVLLYSLRNIVKSGINKQIRKRTHPQNLLQSKINSPIAFCIVHWNAPDFLLLTVSQIELLYPKCKIYVLDNGSQQKYLTSIKAGLKKFNNITLFALLGCPKWAKKIGLESFIEGQSHTAGLQFLLNYSAQQSDEIAVFLDQDCILSTRIDWFFSKFSNDVVLIGAQDRWRGHACSNLIHPSFMILQPKRINQLFGDSSLYDKKTEFLEFYARDPYHGLSIKALGRMLYLEVRMHAKIPLLTSYVYNETVYAWHAWYSSRLIGINSTSIDGYSVSWLQEVRKTEYDFMKQVHKNTDSDTNFNKK
jgi:hypothetical protein